MNVIPYKHLNKWSQIPYPNEDKVYHGLDNNAGYWPLYFIKRNENNSFSTLNGNLIDWEILNPCNVDFKKELIEVQNVQASITCCEIKQAKYWGSGVPVSQITPIALELIKTYSITPCKSAGTVDRFV